MTASQAAQLLRYMAEAQAARVTGIKQGQELGPAPGQTSVSESSVSGVLDPSPDGDKQLLEIQYLGELSDSASLSSIFGSKIFFCVVNICATAKDMTINNPNNIKLCFVVNSIFSISTEI
jgi:hypothetical protein